MYLGYMIAHAGYLLYAPSGWNLAIYAAVWSLLVARIFAEERVLGTDPEYRAFQDRVRARLVPGIF
jgi:protein-S-isoprenylcysteine O-methyltransferase Ste14